MSSSTKLVARPRSKSESKLKPKSRSSRFARYGPPDRYESPPAAGMCLSVFAVVRRTGKGKKGVLMGLPRPNERWPGEWITAWRAYSDEEDDDDLSKIYSEWRLPSAYLAEGEHPADALDRVMKDQLQIPKYSLAKKSPRIFSYYSPSDWYPGSNHWDLAFVYEVDIKPKYAPDGKEEASLPRWWKELRFFRKKKGDFLGKDYGWNSDLMVDLGLVIYDEDSIACSKTADPDQDQDLDLDPDNADAREEEEE